MRGRNAFTIIELIFVIVVLGILATVAIPRFASTSTQAYIAKARSDIASIRAGVINERQSRLLKGDVSYIAALDTATAATEGEQLFGAVLTNNNISANSDGHWMKTAAGYTFKIEGVTVNFTYDSGTGAFTCDRNAAGDEGDYCKRLID